MQGLDEPSRKAIQSVVESNKELFMTITSQTENIMKRQVADSSLATMRHNVVLHAITNQNIEKYSIQDITRKIMNLLYFNRKDDRYDDIAIAHQNTFNWALEGHAKDSRSWPSLVDWLRQDGDVYWISGKAGSGKSTLMKCLYKDPRFMESLKLWAGSDRLIVADFYFWNSGVEIQKSQEGLFRSLLWQVLNQDISLASTLFAEQYLLHAEWNEFPTFHQLRRAFGRLTSHCPTSTKIAIVIDGLDEFDDRRITITELGEMLKTATKGGSVKALLSSRPITAFEDCFAGKPQLRLHQLTYDDITTYVYDLLSVHPQMVYLKTTYNNETKALVEEVVSSASGVFLWVTLVVKSLIEGLQDGDKIEDLQLRLRALPKDLEALFTLMLRNVPTLYKSQASRIFQILRCNNEGHQQMYDVGSGKERPLSAVRLSYAEAKIDEVIGADISPLSNGELEQIECTIERRIRSRCAGLLELRTRSKSQQDETSQVDQRDTKEVVYLHRTVTDFLYEERVWAELMSHAEGLKFHAPLAVLQSLVMEVKTVNLGRQPPADGIPWRLVSDALLFGRLTEATAQTSSQKLFDELDRAMMTYFPDVTGHWKGGEYKEATWCDTYVEDYIRPAPWHDNFMSLTVRFGLTLYVRDTIRKKGRDCLNKRGRPLLDYACRPEPRYEKWSAFNDPNLVETLLLNGADPNLKFNGFSAWQNCLYTETDNPVKWISLLKLLLLHGADANACIETRNEGQKSALNVIKECFDEFIAGDAQATEGIIMRFTSRYEEAVTETVSAETLAQLKLDIVELKELLIERGTSGVHGKVENMRWRLFGKRVTLPVRRFLGRGHK